MNDSGKGTLLSYALRYARQGWPVFPVAGKAPVGDLAPRGFKDATTDEAKIQTWFSDLRPTGIGLPTGQFFFVLDIDPRHGGDASLDALEKLNGPLPDTLQVKTGGGGRHYYFKTPEGALDIKCSTGKVGAGLDIKAQGGYVLAPPSIHPETKNKYEWTHPGDFEAQPILDAPEWLLNAATETPKSKGSVTEMHATVEANRNVWLISEAGKLRRIGLDTANIALVLGKLNTEKCVPPVSSRELAHIVESIGKYKPDDLAGRKLATTLKRVCKEIGGQQNSELGVPLIFDSKGDVSRNLANAAAYLIYHPDFQNSLCFNEFTQAVHVTRDMCDGLILNEQRVNEIAFTELTAELQRKSNVSFSKETVGDAIKLAARRASSHPVRNYFDGIKWDGVPRLDTWLTDYLGVMPGPDTSAKIIAAYGSRWLISAVARILDPGCKVDTCLILEGEQGTGKSSALKNLCPLPQWFTDDISDLTNKDTLMRLHGKWIIELGELGALTRSDSNQIKAFISRTVDEFRAPYDRCNEPYPRQFVFSGSTNNSEYLKDETGARRFWSVRTTVINYEGVATDRDQLWAEARLRYDNGEKWWLHESELWAESQERQAERLEEDVWLSQIARYVAGLHDTSVFEVLMNLDVCGGMITSQIAHSDKIRAAKCLKSLGFEQYRAGINQVSGAPVAQGRIRSWRYRRVKGQ